MAQRNRFQYEVATGGWTLPVAALLFLIEKALYFQLNMPDYWLLVAIQALTAYLLIELNTRFALIRIRTTLPTSFFLVATAAIPSVSYIGAGLALLFVGILFSLFSSYERPNSSLPIFHAFFLLGIACLYSRVFLLVIPLLWILMMQLRSFSLRTFWAGFIGLIFPYWGLAAFLMWQNQLDMFPAYIVVNGWFCDYSSLTADIPTLVLEIVVMVIAFVSSLGHLFFSYQDKVQTRVYLRIFWVALLWTIGLMAVEPNRMTDLIPVQIVLGSILFSHLFALSYTRFTRVAFVIFTVGILLLYSVHLLWILGVNF